MLGTESDLIVFHLGLTANQSEMKKLSLSLCTAHIKTGLTELDLQFSCSNGQNTSAQCISAIEWHKYFHVVAYEEKQVQTGASSSLQFSVCRA